MKLPNGSSESRCNVVVPCRWGLHLRVAARVVTQARQFESHIRLSARGLRADAKSILAIAMLGAVRGQSLTVTARGADAEKAIQALSELFGAQDILCEGDAPS